MTGAPVNNATGLSGTYDAHLRYSLGGPRPDAAESPDVPATIFDALPQQLGLQLVPKKGTVERIVIDHIEKVPTAN